MAAVYKAQDPTSAASSLKFFDPSPGVFAPECRALNWSGVILPQQPLKNLRSNEVRNVPKVKV
jgi:hypothetical protein